MLFLKNLWAVDSDLRVTSGEVTLSGNNLVVVGTKPHALAGPGIEVSLHVDRAGRALVLTNRPILLKGPGAINGWLVGAGRLSDLVGRAVRGDGTLVLGLRRGVVGAEVLDNVVLNKRVASPAVDGEVGVTVVVVGTGVGDGTVFMLVSRYLCLRQKLHTGQFLGSIPFHQQGYHRFPSSRCTDLRGRWLRSVLVIG